MIFKIGFALAKRRHFHSALYSGYDKYFRKLYMHQMRPRNIQQCQPPWIASPQIFRVLLYSNGIHIIFSWLFLQCLKVSATKAFKFLNYEIKNTWNF